MSQSSSQSTSGNVNYGESKQNTWLIVGIVGVVVLGIVWIFNRK